MLKAIISSVGGFVPPKILTNDDLSRMVETNDQWIMDRVGIREDGTSLIKEVGNCRDARKDIIHADFFRRVVVSERLKERSSKQFYVDGGIVAVILNLIELKEVQRDLIVDQMPICGVFGIEGGNRTFLVEALAPLRIKIPLGRVASGTYIIEKGIERKVPACLWIRMVVVSRLRGA